MVMGLLFQLVLRMRLQSEVLAEVLGDAARKHSRHWLSPEFSGLGSNDSCFPIFVLSTASWLFTAFRICVEVTAQTFPEVPVIGVDHSCTPV